MLAWLGVFKGSRRLQVPKRLAACLFVLCLLLFSFLCSSIEEGSVLCFMLWLYIFLPVWGALPPEGM